MNKSFIFGALAGAATGAGITFVAMREYFRAKADGEIGEVREHYISEINKLRSNGEKITKAIETLQEATEPEEVKEEDDKSAKAQEEYEKVLEKENYSNISEQKKPKKQKKPLNKPHCITPEQFNLEADFTKVTLDYWAGNKVFTNIEGGIEDEAGIWVDISANIERFGDYEDELLFVRNDQMNTDYEVMYHEESYESDDI